MHALDIYSFFLQVEQCLISALTVHLTKTSTHSFTKDVRIGALLEMLRNDLQKPNSPLQLSFPGVVASDLDHLIFVFDKCFHKGSCNLFLLKFIRKN